MINFLFGYVLGIACGVYAGIWITAKVGKKVSNEEVAREIINSIIAGEPIKGDFIKINSVEEYIKTHDGEIKLGDVVEDNNG